MLADLGADVLKIEIGRPTSIPFASSGKPTTTTAGGTRLARSFRFQPTATSAALALNLKDPEGATRSSAILAKHCDVVVENFPARRALDRAGALGYAKT